MSNNVSKGILICGLWWKVLRTCRSWSCEVWIQYIVSYHPATSTTYLFNEISLLHESGREKNQRYHIRRLSRNCRSWRNRKGNCVLVCDDIQGIMLLLIWTIRVWIFNIRVSLNKDELWTLLHYSECTRTAESLILFLRTKIWIPIHQTEWKDKDALVLAGGCHAHNKGIVELLGGTCWFSSRILQLQVFLNSKFQAMNRALVQDFLVHFWAVFERSGRLCGADKEVSEDFLGFSLFLGTLLEPPVDQNDAIHHVLSSEQEALWKANV